MKLTDILKNGGKTIVASSVLGIAGLAAIVGFGGCSIPKPTQGAIYNATKVSYDSFRKQSEFRGPFLSTDGIIWMSFGLSGGYSIRGWSEKGKQLFQLYVVEGMYGGWPEFYEAHDNFGNKFPVTTIDTDFKSGGKCIETIGIELFQPYLDGKSFTGFTMRIYGKRKTFDVNVPPAYIQGILKRVNEIK